MPYPDDMNWPLYDRTIGSADDAIMPEPKKTHLGYCDNCNEKSMLDDETNFCVSCIDAMEQYMQAMWRGLSPEDAQIIYDATKASHKARMTNPQTFKEKGELL